MKKLSTLGFFLLSSLVLSNAMAKGAYEVPGSNGGAFYDMDVEIYSVGSEIKAEYVLPLDLTGAENRIEAKGQMIDSSTAILKSDKGELRCNMAERFCEVEYWNLNVDLKQVEARLVGKGLSEDKILEHMEISRRFREDPIGIVHFDSRNIEPWVFSAE